ncbi:MAG: ComEC/Rec2 family competence protein [Verrucomicrobiota bacterium]
MKRPLTIVAVLYAAGLLLGDNFHLPLLWLFVAAFTVLIAAFFSRRNIFVWPVIILAGWINLTSRTEILSPHDLRKQIGNRVEYLSLRGQLSETPSFRVFEFNEEESWRTLARIDVTEIREGGQWRPALGRVMVRTSGILDSNFCAGQRIEVTGIAQTPLAPIAEGLFDYRTYLRLQGIYYQVAVASTNDWRAIGNLRTPPFSDKFFLWAKNILQQGLPVKDEPLRLVWAMTLGWKTALTDEVTEPFMRSGTMHIFAISGLHIALIAGILVALLRVMQMPRGFCGLIVIPLIWFYTAATGWQPSAIRSTIMMTIIVAGWSLKRPTDLLNSLAASAFIILLWEPQQLFQASFQLSFFVVLSIALLLPTFQNIRVRILNPDPLLPPELRPAWRKRMDFPLNFATTAFATSLAAFLGSLPLVAHYFHLVTPVSLLANFVIVPLSSFALMANLGSLVFGNWFPFATELFNHAGWFFMKSMVVCSHWFASWRGGYFYIPAPSILACAIYYLLLFTILNGWLAKPRRRFFTILLMITAVLVIAGRWRSELRTVKITVLPLNGGDAVFVDCPGRNNDLLIDCGNKKSFEFILKPFLRAQGVNRLQTVLLTHGDLKHVGGLKSIQDNFSVLKILTSPVATKSTTYREILSELKNEPDRWQTVRAGDALGAWTVLHPQSSDQFPQADDKAVVLRGTFFGKTILLLSDLGRPGQKALLERTNSLAADFVISGLPAQTEPLCNQIVEAIQPRLILITDTEFPATERASRKIRERLAAQKAQVIYGRESGAVTFIFDEQGCVIRTARGERFDY